MRRKHTPGVLTLRSRMATMTNPITLNLLLEHEYCNGTYDFFCFAFPQKTSHYNIYHELLSKFHTLSLLLPYFYYQQNKYLCSSLYCHKISNGVKCDPPTRYNFNGLTYFLFYMISFIRQHLIAKCENAL